MNSRTLDPFAHRETLLELLCKSLKVSWAIVVLAPSKRTQLDRKPQITAAFRSSDAPEKLEDKFFEMGPQTSTKEFDVVEVIGSRIVDTPQPVFEVIQDVIAYILIPPTTPTEVRHELSLRIGEEITSSRFERVVESISFAQNYIDSRFENTKEELNGIAEFIAKYTRSDDVLICNKIGDNYDVRGSSKKSNASELLSECFQHIGKLYENKNTVAVDASASQKSIIIVPVLVPAYVANGLHEKVVNHFIICAFEKKTGGRVYYSDCDRRVVEVFSKELGTGIAEARQRQSVDRINNQFVELVSSSDAPLRELDVDEIKEHITTLVDNITGVEILNDSTDHQLDGRPIYTGKGNNRHLIFPFLSSLSHAYALKVGIGDRIYLSEYKVRIIENYLSQYKVTESSRALYEEQVTLAAQIRHAIKAPLAAAQEHLAMLAERAHLYAGQPTVFQRLMKTSTMSGAVSNSMLFIAQALSFSEAARSLVRPLAYSDIKWGDYFLAEILSETETMFGPSANARRLRVRYKVDPVFSKYQLSGERTLIAILVHNLVENAIKFAVSGRRVEVSAFLVEDRTRWRLEVTDDGVAIPNEEREKIFEAWQRSEHSTVTNRRPGTGLGLAICRDIVSATDPTGMCNLEQLYLDEERGLARKTFFVEMEVNGRMKAAHEREDKI